MGSELTATSSEKEETVWLSALSIAQGGLEKLKLSPGGRSEATPDTTINATGISKRSYGELLIALLERWNVRAFIYDWRKRVELAAAELEASLRRWFEEDAPVHLVAHSLGGIVARTFILNYGDRWKRMWDNAGNGVAGGRLLLIGTPHYGAPALVGVLTGTDPLIRKLDLLDEKHRLEELLEVINSFPSLYQLLPSPKVFPEAERIYKKDAFAPAEVSSDYLLAARKHQKELVQAIDPERMINVLGWDQLTPVGVRSEAALSSPDVFEVSREGDGFVPVVSGRLNDVPEYFVRRSHGDLVSDPLVLEAIHELLAKGSSSLLASEMAQVPERGPRAGYSADPGFEISLLETLVPKLRRGFDSREQPVYINPEERKIEENLTRQFLSGQSQLESDFAVVKPLPTPTIEIRLRYGLIDEFGIDEELDLPVDAMAVGHYTGVKPVAAELAIDRALSRTLNEREQARGSSGKRDSNLLITDFTQRGIIQGELGQLFFLSDPRNPERVVVVAGMGVPGRFGVSELALLVREVCWAVGRVGKRHLATVLIGGGNGNLAIGDAVEGWLRGIRDAILTRRDAEGLQRVTFVECDPAKTKELNERIQQSALSFRNRRQLDIKYEPLDEATLKKLDSDITKALRARAKAAKAPRHGRIPTRISLSIEGDRYRFGALTESASIPERVIRLDPELIREANRELAAERDPARQVELGRFLGKLLLPQDLQPQLAGNVPLVMMLDSSAARIHWEMLSFYDADNGPVDPVQSLECFLGTSRGFTRQLRTTFAPPPEPPPPPRRLLRVLVVADPAEEARLPGAELEGIEVADLLERFNSIAGRRTDNRVEVVRLFGPREATRTNVLRHLMLQKFDILHYAGHCFYNPEDPASSGWIFSGKQRLTARELTRIDRVPRFVFSNACESGITPDRSELRSEGLAPSFAEEFFGRGVTNFVCTAWPVDDVAARQFAARLYAGLLGVKVSEQGEVSLGEPESMHEAMYRARTAVAEQAWGARTWGAYQHYGNPNFRFFESHQSVD